MSVHVLSWVLKHSEARQGERLVLIVLADHARDDGSGAWPAHATIAQEARLSERQVIRCLANLERDGHIARQGHSRAGTNVWAIQMTPDKLSVAQDTTLTSTTENVSQMSPEPSLNRPETANAVSPVRRVFDEWVSSTDRDPKRTVLTAGRRSQIERALKSHGLDDCLAAVAHIGADHWARGGNDRGRRFDDIEHALGNAERIERWRDQEPRSRNGAAPANPCPGSEPAADVAWAAARETLRTRVGADTFATWLEPLHAHHLNGGLVVGAPASIAGWVRDRFGDILTDTAGQPVVVEECAG